MLKLYRRFLPHVKLIQAPLHDVLSGHRVNGSHPSTCTLELLKAFEKCQASLSRTTLLVHPDPPAPLSLVTDASTTAMVSVMQQCIKNTWQPLAFFSTKLNPAQQKYSTYERELLAIYEAVKHFRHMLEARQFIFFTGHKPITYAIQQKQDRRSPRQLNHLDFVGPLQDRHTAYLWTGQRCRRRPLAASPSLRHHPTTHRPHRWTAPTSSEHSWGQPPPCDSRNYKSPVARSPSTTKRLPGDLNRTFKLPFSSKCSVRP
jgi:hypothetical protein